MLFEVDVSCRILYLIVSYLYVCYSGSITSDMKEGANLSCNYVVSVLRGFIFLLVLGIGCVILLWHSLALAYNYLYVSIEVSNYMEYQGSVRFELRSSSKASR